MTPEFSLRLVRGGYPAAADLRDGRPAVPIRMLGRRSALVGGPESVRRFYDARLRRQGAIPLPLRAVLFGPGAVHGLDDAAHHTRKSLFTTVLRPHTVTALGETLAAAWSERVGSWRGPVDLFDEAVDVVGSAVLMWSGASLTSSEARQRATQLADVVDGFASPGRAYVRAVRARRALDRWARGLVVAERGRGGAPAGSALQLAASWPDDDGNLLPSRVAAVEYLNVVRPTVAATWFVAFAAVALDAHPTWRERIAAGDGDAALAVAHEVRRLYPFVPVLAARTRCAQDVLGVRVPRGGYVVLDVHGTDHDPVAWVGPDRFDPERFLAGAVVDDALVPQGGGTVEDGHRCPGEDVVLTVVTTAVRALAGRATLAPGTDTGHPLTRLPTRPRGGPLVCPVRH